MVNFLDKSEEYMDNVLFGIPIAIFELLSNKHSKKFLFLFQFQVLDYFFHRCFPLKHNI